MVKKQQSTGLLDVQSYKPVQIGLSNLNHHNDTICISAAGCSIFFAEHWSHEKPGWPSSHRSMNLPPCSGKVRGRFVPKIGYAIGYMGLSENGVYSQWNSHLIGIMISKTIGFRGTNHFQTNPYLHLKTSSLGAFQTKPDFRRCQSMFCLGNMQVGHGLKFKSAELGRTYPKLTVMAIYQL